SGSPVGAPGQSTGSVERPAAVGEVDASGALGTGRRRGVADRGENDEAERGTDRTDLLGQPRLDRPLGGARPPGAPEVVHQGPTRWLPGDVLAQPQQATGHVDLPVAPRPAGP